MHFGGCVKLREVLPSEGKRPRRGCFFPNSPSRPCNRVSPGRIGTEGRRRYFLGSTRQSRARGGKREASLGRDGRPAPMPALALPPGGAVGARLLCSPWPCSQGWLQGFPRGSWRSTTGWQSTGFSIKDCPVPEARRAHGPDRTTQSPPAPGSPQNRWAHCQR